MKDYEIAIGRMKERPSNIKDLLLSYVGVARYDYISLTFFQVILQAFGIWIGRVKEKAKAALYCSELCALVNKKYFPKWWTVTGKDIENHPDLLMIISRVKGKSLLPQNK